jgi:hypothetical protein
MKYPQPPHIQLGFYWDNRPCTNSYSAVLGWLLEQGFRQKPGAVLIRANGSNLPPYPLLEQNDLAEDALKVEPNWVHSQSPAPADWLPVRVQYDTGGACPLELEAGYGFMMQAAVEARANRVVEILISGADANLLDNVDPKSLPPKVVTKAKESWRLQETVFSGVCRDLVPAYAACSMEESLQPPQTLNKLTILGLFGRWFVASTTVDSQTVIDICESPKRFRTTPIEQGVFVDPVGTIDAATQSALKDLIAHIQVGLGH